jgi:ABC-type branched-subunit amino acid transport system ATPase component
LDLHRFEIVLIPRTFRGRRVKQGIKVKAFAVLGQNRAEHTCNNVTINELAYSKRAAAATGQPEELQNWLDLALEWSKNSSAIPSNVLKGLELSKV